MLLLSFVSTFSAVLLAALALWQRQMARRRAWALLVGSDPVSQAATRFRPLDWSARWERDARQADLNWPARTYVLICLIGSLLGLIGVIVRGPVAFFITLLTALGPWVLVRYRQRVRAGQFSEQLPSALTLAAHTIRSGGTLLQAISSIARQMPEPIKGEFERVERALRLHVPIADALDDVRQRIGSPEFTAVVVACKVAGQAGADLDLVLEKIANEIVEDRQFRAAMQAASSEGRASAKVVTVIPFLVGGYFWFKDPRYFDPMLMTPGGRIMLFGSFIAIGLGWVLIKRITDANNW